VRDSQSNASVSNVWFKCVGTGCYRSISYSPITGRFDVR